MEAFTSRQRDDINASLRQAERATGLRMSVYVGRAQESPRRFAARVHAALGDEAPRTVLIFVDPPGRALEIITGEVARLRVSDAECRLVAMSMATAFSVGDLAGGLVRGIGQLADHARRPAITG